MSGPDPLAELLTLDSWITSDHHLGARSYPGRPEDWLVRARRAWFDRVGADDVLLHLGDLLDWSAQGDSARLLRRLPGRKLLILGNSDKRPELYARAGWQVLGRGDRPFYWGDREADELVAFSHEPLRPSDHPFDVNVHGHTHEGDPWSWYEAATRVNACVERTGYAPVRLRELLETRAVTGT